MQHKTPLIVPATLLALSTLTQAANVWSGYAGDAQHTALSSIQSLSLQSIKWQTPVDLNPQYSGEDLLIHYGSPSITSANTVIVPVKTGATDGFKIEARSGVDGSLKWLSTTDYTLPAHYWTPSYSPTITSSGRVYYPGAGGTILYQDQIDTNSPTAPTRLAFFGNSAYASNPTAYNSTVQINTPITSDSSGNIYFGYQVSGSNPLNLSSGIARIDASGNATYTDVAQASSNEPGIVKVAMNSAPALSNDGSKLYVTVSDGSFGSGDLLCLNSSTLAPVSKVALKDPRSVGVNSASIYDIGTASPMVGPDGDVYFGVLEKPFTNDRGWMLHFNSDLSVSKTPGSFGWDDTASVVPASMVPSYHGSSTYLLMSKYNNYANPGLGGDGVNQLAILDPNDTQIDPRTGETVMKEILTIAGLTPDEDYLAAHPNAVREWCINTAVVDPASHSILANSEDGKLYRWDLWTNTFTEQIVLTPGLGEAYTPTLIGADGTVYAINNATLFAIVPEPASISTLLLLPAVLLRRRRV